MQNIKHGMEFVKFPSLENTYRQAEIDKIYVMDVDCDWVVTSKVHGSNYSFWLELDESGDVSVKPAKRTSFIEPDEKFFNHKPVFEKYKGKLIELFNDLGCKTMVVYGELYGGNVQQGMCYPLEQDFIAFDLKVDGVAQNKMGSFRVLNNHGIPTVPVLGIFAKFEDALAVNEYYTSLLIRDGFTGADEHREEEGVVIEPAIPHYEANGSRVYLKKKTKRFMENTVKGDTGNKQPSVLDSKVAELLELSSQYINENRFNSVVSKIGEVTIKDIGKVTGLMAQDVIVDLEKDTGVPIDETLLCDKQLRSQYMKNLQKSVMAFIKPILLKL